LSRLRFAFALAALIALATALAACGGSSKSSEDPQTVVNEATLQGIESGNLDLSLAVDAAGKEGGNVDLSLSGPFQAGEGKGSYPQFDMAAKADGKVNGEAVSFDGGLTLLPNTAYVDYKGTEYEVDPTTFSFVESALKEAEKRNAGGGESAGLTACQEEAGKLKVADFMENLSNEGSSEVGGTSTTKVSGDLDVAGAIDAVVELVEGPACKAQLGAAGPLPSKAEIDRLKGEVSGAVKTAHAELFVGGDNIVRQISAQLKIEPKSPGSGPQSVEVKFDLKLTGVNEEQEISAPANSKPLNDLFAKLGVNPIELLGLLQGQGGGAGLGNLLEGLAGGHGGSGGGQQAYLNCIAGAHTATDIQKCTAKLG
jgi:hypothetical protein